MDRKDIDTNDLIPGTPVAIMADKKNAEVAKAVLSRLQADLEQSAKDAGAHPTEILFCVWTTLGRCLTQSGANAGALIATFLATHPEIVAASFDDADDKTDAMKGPSIFKTPSSDSIN